MGNKAFIIERNLRMILKNCKKIIANVAFISDRGVEFLKTIHHMRRKDNHKKILISENTGTAKLAQGKQ